MFKKIVCFLLSLLTVLPLLGCVSEVPETESTVAIETTEIAIEETTESTIETTPATTEPISTEPEVQRAPNGDEITEILHLKIKALNIRKNPNDESKILGCFRKGDEITVIGRGGNGSWLKVYFYNRDNKGIIGYCSNGHYFEEGRPAPILKTNTEQEDEVTKSETTPVEEPVETENLETTLATTEPVVNETEVPETTVPETTEPKDPTPEGLALENQGSYGRLIVPSANISCQLNLVDVESSEASYMAQHYTDMEDSAAIFKSEGMYVISDHKDQSFGKLEDVNKKDVAYIGCGDKVIKLYCYKMRYGKNGEDNLTTDHGENGTGFDGYLMYTFSDSKEGYDIYMTYWREKTW